MVEIVVRMKMNYNIRLIDFGIAYAYDHTIEINRELLNHKKLMNLVLEHEKEHLEKPSFWQTILIDLKDGFDFKKQKLLSKLPFRMKLQSSIPIWYDNKSGICVNVTQLFIYVGIITLVAM